MGIAGKSGMLAVESLKVVEGREVLEKLARLSRPSSQYLRSGVEAVVWMGMAEEAEVMAGELGSLLVGMGSV